MEQAVSWTPGSSHTCSGTQLRDSAGRVRHRLFHAHGVPFQRLHVKKNQTISAVHLSTTGSCFPFSCNLSCPGGCYLPHMGGWWTVRLRRRNALSQTNYFSPWRLKRSRSFSNFQAEQARWRLGKRGRREQHSTVTFSRTCSRSDWRGQIWIQVSQIPIHRPTLPSAPRREISLTAHLIRHTLPLSLKISRKRSVNSRSKMMAKLITFYSYYVPLHR